MSNAVVNDMSQDHGDGVGIGKPKTHEVQGVGEGVLQGVDLVHSFPQPRANQVVCKLVLP